VGAVAPDAQLTDGAGTRVALATALHRRAETVVVFYRGFW
jgi:peroxiredoxin